MAEVWPATLQQKLNEASFDHALGDTSVTSDMDISLPKKRRRYTDGVDTFSCTIDLERDLYSDLYSFYNTTLNGGVKTFNFDHPITGVEDEFQFVEAPTFSPLGGRYFRVRMNWRKIP